MSDFSDGTLVLGGEFATPTRDEWLELAEGVLKGKPFDKVLVTKLYDGVSVQPLYAADGSGVDGEHRPPAAGLPGAAPFVRGSTPARGDWDVRQRVDVTADLQATNVAVLTELERGATSVVLGLTGVDPASYPAALKAVLAGVYLDLAGVVLDAGPDFAAAAAALDEVIADTDAAPSSVRGSLGADPLISGGDLADAAALAAKTSTSRPGLRTFVVDGTIWHDGGASDAEELGCSVATAVAYLRAMSEAGMELDAAAGQIEFRFALAADQFSGIAKLRAARRLWSRVTELCGSAQPQLQHGVTSSAMMTQRDPWVNLLRTTIACFAGGVGGADAITVQPFDAAIGLPDSFARRIARNTQSLLLDESNLARVGDPAGGSFYVESLTDQLAAQAWSWFQQIEASGAMAAALDSGLIHDRVGATWQSRATNLARRSDAICGVSEFPDLAAEPLARPPAAPPRPSPITAHRYSEAFEALRDRTDAAASRPTVFLANLGPIATHNARAGFAKNFFEVGGIAIVSNDGFDDVAELAAAFGRSGATIACICSSDAIYAERAAETAAALKQAGAVRVYIAGRFEADDIDEEIYTGSDALSTLTRALDVLALN